MTLTDTRRWSCLAIKLASLARSSVNYAPNPALLFTGAYIEAAPNVVFGVFLFTGTAFFLWVKAAKGPGPYIFASVFGCISLGRSRRVLGYPDD
jgi:hypothetical protein